MAIVSVNSNQHFVFEMGKHVFFEAGNTFLMLRK
jgi:hypothetical protein